MFSWGNSQLFQQLKSQIRQLGEACWKILKSHVFIQTPIYTNNTAHKNCMNFWKHYFIQLPGFDLKMCSIIFGLFDSVFMLCFQSQENFVATAEEKLSCLMKSKGLSYITSPAQQAGTPASSKDRRPDAKASPSSWTIDSLPSCPSFDLWPKNSSKAGGVGQKPWTLHPHWQEASCNKLFCREESKQPEEEESPGLPVTYPIAAPAVTPELIRCSLCKKDIRPPSKIWDTQHFKTCSDSDPKTCQFTSGGRVGERWRTGHDWHTGTAYGQFRLFTRHCTVKMMHVLQSFINKVLKKKFKTIKSQICLAVFACLLSCSTHWSVRNNKQHYTDLHFNHNDWI